MPSSKGYRPTAFHVTYARQEQRSSKSPLLIRPAGLTTLFRYTSSCASVQKLPSLVPGINQRSSAMHEMSVVTKPVIHCPRRDGKHDVHRLLLVRVRYGHSPTSSRKPSFAFERLRREPTSKALCWKPKRFPSLSSVPNADILSRPSRESISLRRVHLRRAIRAFNGNGPRAVRPAYRGGIKELIVEIPVIRNVLEANGKLAASLKDQFAKHGILA